MRNVIFFLYFTAHKLLFSFRSCWIFYLNYVVVFPTCLLAPWFYCLIKRDVRRRIFKYIIGCSCRKQNDIRISVKKEDTRVSSCCVKFHPKLLFRSPMRHHKIGTLPQSPLHSKLQPELNFPSVISESFNSIVVMLHNGGNIKEAIRNGISTSVPPGVLMAPPVVATISENVVPRQINVIPDIVLLYKPTKKSEEDSNWPIHVWSKSSRILINRRQANEKLQFRIVIHLNICHGMLLSYQCLKFSIL